MTELTLYQFDGAWGLPSCSPFSLKMQTYLRMANVPYRTVSAFKWNSPTNKLPFLEDETGKRIHDTEDIIAYLKGRFGDPLDANLSADERARAHLLRRTVEEHLYFVNLYFRWAFDDNRAIMYAAFVGKMTPEEMEKDNADTQRTFLPKIAALGIGGHTPERIAEKGVADIEAVSTMLGDKDFVLGSRPTSVDASVYGLFANILGAPIETPIKAFTLSRPNLVTYCDRIRRAYFAGP